MKVWSWRNGWMEKLFKVLLPSVKHNCIHLDLLICTYIVLTKSFNFSHCNKTHTETTASNKEKIKTLLPQLFQSNLLCAGVVIGTQGSCHGDSGGPLMIYSIETKQWTQIALVQGGIGKACYFKYL